MSFCKLHVKLQYILLEISAKFLTLMNHTEYEKLKNGTFSIINLIALQFVYKKAINEKWCNKFK